jgi:hypothetical protein
MRYLLALILCACSGNVEATPPPAPPEDVVCIPIDTRVFCGCTIAVAICTDNMYDVDVSSDRGEYSVSCENGGSDCYSMLGAVQDDCCGVE